MKLSRIFIIIIILSCLFAISLAQIQRNVYMDKKLLEIKYDFDDTYLSNIANNLTDDLVSGYKQLYQIWSL